MNTMEFGLSSSLGFFVTEGFQMGPYFAVRFQRYQFEDTEGYFSEDVGDVGKRLDLNFGFQLGYFFRLKRNDNIFPFIKGAAFVVTGSTDDDDEYVFKDNDVALELGISAFL